MQWDVCDSGMQWEFGIGQKDGEVKGTEAVKAGEKHRKKRRKGKVSA